jgi:hypothetical protein
MKHEFQLTVKPSSAPRAPAMAAIADISPNTSKPERSGHVDHNLEDRLTVKRNYSFITKHINLQKKEMRTSRGEARERSGAERI